MSGLVYHDERRDFVSIEAARLDTLLRREKEYESLCTHLRRALENPTDPLPRGHLPAALVGDVAAVADLTVVTRAWHKGGDPPCTVVPDALGERPWLCTYPKERV